jgi:GNAT superfamily N-acetyltransferase
VITVDAVTGPAIEAWLGALAELRIAVFREYPYLYAGSHEYERGYLARYAAEPANLVVIARDGGRVVGAATAMPLAAAEPEVASALAGFADTFYFGESVLERGYRGRGIGHRFFDLREAHARSAGATTAAFCAVERPDDHPRRPPGYVPHDAFWTKRGYVRHPELVATFTWRDLDDGEDTAKPMTFWTRSL